MNISEILVKSIVIRRALCIGWYAIGLMIAYLGAFLLRFDGRITPFGMDAMLSTYPVFIAVCLIVFGLFRLYSGMWSYFGVDDLLRMGVAMLAAIVLFAGIIYSYQGMMFAGYPRSVFVVVSLLMGFWMTGSRFAARFVREKWFAEIGVGDSRERMLVVGRVADADLLIRGTQSKGIGKVVGVITDDPAEQNMTLRGVPTLGPPDRIGEIARQYRAGIILLLPPFNKPGQLKDLVDRTFRAGAHCVFRTLPSMAELATGELRSSVLKDVDIEDLLARGTHVAERPEVRHFLKGKKIMITGAGGSIGSELCRQIASYEPACMVLFEYSELHLFDIDRELRAHFPSLRIMPVAGDIRHVEELESAIDSAGGIDVIYHSAAYKHVPLMELNIPAAFRTNVLGTQRVAEVAVRKKVDRMVLISSDKAVRPTSIMGMTKRIAERIVSEMPANGTTMVSVRFGNVLGSSGSVVPVFKEQIAKGGPVTVTSPEVRRFFMTIPEAVDLLLLAGTVGRHRDVMVLEMGEQIKIVDLARRLIELSGLVPDKDIKIVFTGMRPGEKEFEEVMTADENVDRTSHDKIWVLRKETAEARGLVPIDPKRVETLVLTGDGEGLRKLAGEYVPELGGKAENRKFPPAQE